MVPLGPVAEWELVALARRKRYFVVRTAYGLVLFAFFCGAMSGYPWLPAASVIPLRLLRQIVGGFFVSIVGAQALGVLVLTPALVAGVIADEKARGNLPLLLTTSVSGLEIVVGKLAVRLSHLIVLLTVSLPVFCLLSLMGGLDPVSVLLSYAATFTSCFLLAAIAMAASTFIERPDRAIMSTYALVGFWLALPFLAAHFQPAPSSAFFSLLLRDWLISVEFWNGCINPLYILFGGMRWVSPFRGPGFYVALYGMMAAHLAIGAILLGCAAAALRRQARGMRSALSRGKLGSFLWSRRPLLWRPRCGDRPVLWKESHSVSGTALARLISAAFVLGAVSVLAFLTWRLARPAFLELLAEGYGSAGLTNSRDTFSEFLLLALLVTYLAWTLSLTATTARSVTGEIERGTWVSLLTTPLSARDLAFGKLLGAFARLRWLGLLYFLLLGLGLVAGALHPVSVLLVTVQTILFVIFGASLGLAVSLLCKTSARALAWAMLALLAVNGGYLLLGIPLGVGPDSAFAVSPYILALCLRSYREVDTFLRGASSLGPPVTRDQIVMAILMNLGFYVAAIFVLISFCLAQLETMTQRGQRARPRRRHSQRKALRPLPSAMKSG
jgi:ABC-type transport system involved in multi-copper enzyme maturation permease subunit